VLGFVFCVEELEFTLVVSNTYLESSIPERVRLIKGDTKHTSKVAEFRMFLSAHSSGAFQAVIRLSPRGLRAINRHSSVLNRPMKPRILVVEQSPSLLNCCPCI
jgi:hypothetical protein